MGFENCFPHFESNRELTFRNRQRYPFELSEPPAIAGIDPISFTNDFTRVARAGRRARER